MQPIHWGGAIDWPVHSCWFLRQETVYLCFDHPELRAAAVAALGRYGAQVGGEAALEASGGVSSKRVRPAASVAAANDGGTDGDSGSDGHAASARTYLTTRLDRAKRARPVAAADALTASASDSAISAGTGAHGPGGVLEPASTVPLPGTAVGAAVAGDAAGQPSAHGEAGDFDEDTDSLWDTPL